MDFVLVSKVLTLLAYPAGLMFVLLILSLVFRLLGRRVVAGFCQFLCVAILLVSTNPYFAHKLVQSLEQRFPQSKMENLSKHDAIIVLGGGLRIPLPPAQRAQLADGADRFWYAAQLFKAGKADKIFLAGGNLFSQIGMLGEADYVQQMMIEWGLPESAIFIESNSRNTQQNRDNLSGLLLSQQVDTALLVTSGTHMPRAYRLFSELPIALTAASADVVALDDFSPGIFSWLPSASALEMTTRALHEYYGMFVLDVSKRLKAFTSSG